MSTLSTAGWRVIRSALILWEKVKGNPTSFYDKLGPITEFSWGHFVIDDCHHAGGEFPQGVGSDIWVLGGRVSAWRERTGHVLNIEMIPNVFYDGVAVLVIGLGVCEAVRCSLEVVRSIQVRGIPEVICQRTPLACGTYNRLIRKGRRAAFLAHGTC